ASDEMLQKIAVCVAQKFYLLFPLQQP
ncbi:MAG: hypothetical protein RL248_2075, partial [Pseudomonadota bacterium]